MSLSGEEIEANIRLAKRAALKGVSEMSMEKEKDCQRNIKLAKEAAWAVKDTTKRPCGRPRKSSIPAGMTERGNGNWQVRVFFQGSYRCIGTFPTFEQATLADEIARSMFKKSTSSVPLNEQEIEAIKRTALKGVSEMNMEKEKDYFI